MSHAPSEQRSPDPSLIGGRYRIESVLAEGGMGVVYQVVDERTGNQLALKRLRGGDSRQVRALFEREYRTLVGIQHPRIVRAYDYGVDASGPYYTMELVLGHDLRELAPLPLRDACLYLRDVATCLALLHTRRLLHRDVTARNVRVLPNGECRLIDFGALMSFGVPERSVGTPPYIPPESLRRVALDQRSDIFSFGALFYWVLTRKHAYPARVLEELPEMWRARPAPPSSLVPSLSPQVDTFVMSLLSQDPLARPATMTEVVERMTRLAQLPPEDPATVRALAESYLVQASFVGRARELHVVRADLDALPQGRGAAIRIGGPSGVGRSRLLRELLEHVQLSGVTSVHVDAGMHPQPNGTAIALVHGLLDTSEAARTEAQTYAQELAQLQPRLAERLGLPAAPAKGVISGEWRARTQEVLLAIVTAACSQASLVILVDDVDECDEGSLALLAGLVRLSELSPLLLVLGDKSEGDERASMSWRLIRERTKKLELAPLSASETLALVGSLFGDAPSLARFSEWLHEAAGGLPLHCMRLVRRLHASGEIRYLDGLWVLPSERPASTESEGLADLLAKSVDELSEPARALAEALAVERGVLSRGRCLAHARAESEYPFTLLDELVRNDVLEDALQAGYRFTHALLRSALLQRMGDARRRALHLRCAHWELSGAQARTGSRIAAGWHLLQAGEESRGADELAAVAFDGVGVRFALGDLQVAAPALEAALAVYTKQGRDLYERLPLLAALAQAGYYEDRKWGDRYGDAALAAAVEVSGLGLVRKLAPWLGRRAGLACALLFAWLRFSLRRKRGHTYRFIDVLTQLFAVVLSRAAMASIVLDVQQTERAAATIAPFLGLPERLAPAGIAQLCDSLKEIGRENQAHAIAVWSTLLERFSDPRWYRTLPKRARPLHHGGLWFVRGVFEAFRDDNGALVAAAELDALGLKLYRMIASALRALHYANRGELEQARRHREQVDVHAMQIGSAWQVELWEPAALTLVHTATGDVTELRRVGDRLQTLARKYPSLARYAQFAELGLALASEDDGVAQRDSVGRQRLTEGTHEALRILESEPPRSFIGWGALVGNTARGLNMLGQHADAKALCERALSHLVPADRAFVALFLSIEIELALADAGLGHTAAAKARLDELLVVHQRSTNPLTRGRIHAGYAQMAAGAADWPTFRHHMEQARGWYRGTGTPALIAQANRLRALDPGHSDPPTNPGRSTRRVRLRTPPVDSS